MLSGMTEDLKICDHKSVGMFVWTNQKLLLIERVKGTLGFAIPAGHVDGDLTYDDAAKRELKEEVGLNTINLEKVAEGRKENFCHRTDGSWHFWKLYKVIVGGELAPSPSETKKAGWYSIEEIKKFAEKTEKYNKKEISEEQWAASPGLEPVMLEWFKELKII
jgi:ADP-ribose pyrophosphatase YjhB (NUDIX family)